MQTLALLPDQFISINVLSILQSDDIDAGSNIIKVQANAFATLQLSVINPFSHDTKDFYCAG